jgi:hypothetical protein
MRVLEGGAGERGGERPVELQRAAGSRKVGVAHGIPARLAFSRLDRHQRSWGKRMRRMIRMLRIAPCGAVVELAVTI